MASFLKDILGGGSNPAQKPLSGDDAGFADFASGPEPQPESLASTLAKSFTGDPRPTISPAVPFTKWYRVWERTQVSDFYQEMIIIPFIAVILFVHIFGKRANKKRAVDWAKHHAPALAFEFASVGVDRRPRVEDGSKLDPVSILKENKADEYITYATGRNNVAFLDIKLILLKRYNPFIILGEQLLGFVMESVPPTEERMEAVMYPFDNRESLLVPLAKDESAPKTSNSSYDGFVFAIVHKKMLQRVREDRYDLSLTSTKDHPKLPLWATVLSEGGEITDALLTPELVKAVSDAGELFQTLIITDQPLEKPSTLVETVPRKRISLTIKLPSNKVDYVKTIPLFANFLRLPDFLVQTAKFRPEVLRKVKQVRDAQINKIKKENDDAEAEERKIQQDKDKKEKREQLLKSMSAPEQKKFLEKEREKETRRSQKKRTMRA